MDGSAIIFEKVYFLSQKVFILRVVVASIVFFKKHTFNFEVQHLKHVLTYASKFKTHVPARGFFEILYKSSNELSMYV